MHLCTQTQTTVNERMNDSLKFKCKMTQWLNKVQIQNQYNCPLFLFLYLLFLLSLKY